MRVAAAVPVKDFSRAKRRLRARFADDQVERILRALLADVLGALLAARRIERVVVLTDDGAVAAAARALGAQVRERKPDPGLNPAIDEAARELQDEGFDALLVALGDLPLLTGADADAVVEAADAHAVVIVPADDGGTALLLRRPPTLLPALFGPESASAHESAARERGLEPQVLISIPEATRCDLDTPEDARRLLEAGGRSQTVDVLRELLA